MPSSRTQVHNKNYISILFLYIIILIISSFTKPSSSSSSSSSQEDDRITKLPGQPSTPLLTQFSGYITVNQDHGRALFYWFFPAQSQPLNKPLLLWLNGGPGCSSIAFGAAVELGPLRVNENGLGLDFNTNSWNNEANLLFVESPVGVGFSYTNTSSDINKLDDTFAAEDTYNFLVNWLQRFPQYKTHDFFIAGESYAGHYVPQLAEVVYDRNKDTSKYPHINLKGFIVGNPETDDSYDYRGILEYAWSHSIISDTQYEKGKKECDFKLINWSKECNTVMGIVFEKYREIDIYNIYSPKCLLNTSTTVAASSSYLDSLFKGESNPGLMRRMQKIPLGGYNPCYSPNAEKYFSRIDVQKALHANPGVNYKACSDEVNNNYNFNVFSVLPIYKKLIKAGLKIWLYSGDCDGRVSVIGSRYCVESLGLPLKSPWRSWFHFNQVGGRIVEFEGLTMVTIRGAGHLVPLDKPIHALAIIHSFLTGNQLN